MRVAKAKTIQNVFHDPCVHNVNSSYTLKLCLVCLCIQTCKKLNTGNAVYSELGYREFSILMSYYNSKYSTEFMMFSKNYLYNEHNIKPESIRYNRSLLYIIIITDTKSKDNH